MIYMFLSNNPSSGDINSSNLSCFTVGLNTVDMDLNQYKIVVPLFGTAYAAPNKITTILC